MEGREENIFNYMCLDQFLRIYERKGEKIHCRLTFCFSPNCVGFGVEERTDALFYSFITLPILETKIRVEFQGKAAPSPPNSIIDLNDIIEQY
jgi:hypothetical protein